MKLSDLILDQWVHVEDREQFRRMYNAWDIWVANDIKQLSFFIVKYKLEGHVQYQNSLGRKKQKWYEGYEEFFDQLLALDVHRYTFFSEIAEDELPTVWAEIKAIPF